MDAQIGFGTEGSYGNGVVVDHFFELTKESLKGDYKRIESSGIRRNAKAARADRFQVNPKGAAGDMDLEVLSKGFEYFLPFIFGNSSSTTGASGEKIYTATLGNLRGKSFTAQVAREGADGTLQPFTYEGGKVKSIELATSVDDVLTASLGFDFARETVPGIRTGQIYNLAEPVYPTGATLLTYVGGSFKLDNTLVDVLDMSVSLDNGLKDDRWYINPNGTKGEPQATGLRTPSWKASVEFRDLAQLRRVASLTNAGALGVVEMKWQGTVPVVGTVLPSLTVTLPLARFDGDLPTVDSREMLTHELSGVALEDDNNPSAITVTYVTV